MFTVINIVGMKDSAWWSVSAAADVAKIAPRLAAPSEQKAAISHRVWMSEPASARLLGLIAAAVQNTR